MTDATQTNIIQTKTNKAALIRELLAQKKKPDAIAAEVGCKVQYVYSVQNYERVRLRKVKAKAKYEKKKSAVAGAVKRKYNKSGKYAKKAAVAKAPATPMVAQPVVKTQYIEVEVPQPHYNLTWKQRFVALFFGRV